MGGLIRKIQRQPTLCVMKPPTRLARHAFASIAVIRFSVTIKDQWRQWLTSI
jgi:hypothetical protein